MSLFEEIIDAGIPYDHHESDLYIPANEQTDAILAGYPIEQQNSTRFINRVTKTWYYDVPFAYMPFWTAKQRNEQVKQAMQQQGEQHED